MDEEKIVVTVKSEFGRELVIETPEGKEKTYHLNPIRTMHLHVDKLQVSKGTSVPDCGGSDEPDTQPELPMCVRGTATLEGRSISVIGESDSAVCTLSISFKALDEDGRKQREERAMELSETPRYTSATVGFSRHDRKIGNDNDWFIECEVSPDALEVISSAVSSHTLHGMSVGLTLHGIYSDDDWAPPSIKTRWYLRPNRQDNTTTFPEMAHGDIANLALTLVNVQHQPEDGAEPDSLDSAIAIANPDHAPAAANLQHQPEAKPEPEQDSHENPIPEPIAAQSSSYTTALYMLSDKVERLDSMLTWAGGIIAFFLLLLAFK